jgi:TolB-like protein
VSLIAELQRRKVFKVSLAYLVVAWLVIQVVAILAPQMHLPEWIPSTITLILLVGFPIAVVMAWFFDVTPEGVVRDPADVAVPPAAPLAEVAPVAASVEKSAAQKSIAVLAFADLSPTHDHEYFSDGMAEEILNALAKIKDLKVAGRTSSFYYKGRHEDLRSIGKTLGVANLLEGSVRKQGDRVRITAQLIRSDDGFHLWSETYDGDLSDVFELQDQIARAITGKLDLILHGDQHEQLVPVATVNPEAYALYLQATGIFNRRHAARFPDAIAQLKDALRLDPKFARGHARLASLYALATLYTSSGHKEMVDAADKHARLALDLDPKLAEPHVALGLVCSQQRRYIDQRVAFDRAIAIDPDDATSLYWLASMLIYTGYTAKGNAVLDRVLAIDPIMPIALFWRGLGHAYAGEMDRAERLLGQSADVGLGHVGFGLSVVAYARGQADEAIAQETAANRMYMSDFLPGSAEVLARGCYGSADARAEALRFIDDYLATEPAVIAGLVPRSMVRMGQPARALALVQDRWSNNDPIFYYVLWTPEGHVARSLPEFPQFARRTGLAALWDLYGAPDLCHQRQLRNSPKRGK